MTRKERAVLVQVADTLNEVYVALKNDKAPVDDDVIVPRVDVLLVQSSVKRLLYADTDRRRIK